MKNRPIAKHSKQSPLTSVKTLLTSGLGLIGIGSLLLFTFFVSSNSLNQQQDTRSDASVPESSVYFSQTTSGPTGDQINKENTIDVSLNTGTYKLKEVTAIFDVVTKVAPDITVEGASSNLTYTIEKENADHGFKVSVVAVPKEAAAGIATNRQQMNFLKIKYVPTKPGPISLVYDRDRSHAFEFGMDPNNDLLLYPRVFLYQVSGTTPPSGTLYPEDLFLLNDNLDGKFTFFETTGSRNQVDPRNLIKTRSYTVRHTARVQNVNDESTFTDDPIILTQLRVNNSENVTRSFNRSNLTKDSKALELQLETTFTAQDVNTFAVTVDSTNVFPELNEDNNTVSVSYTTSATGKACNEVCSSNADCGDNHSCYDTGSEKRCRLTTNLTSTSCTSDSTKRNLSCNQECSSNNQCGNGLTCWENRCRNPYNTGSNSCVNADARTQQLIAESCNDSCSANRDCANNMRCFNGSCRLATNPSSSSCSAATETTVSQGAKGGVITPPRATATPRPTSTPQVTATPSATPSATPTPIVQTPTPAPVATPTPKPDASVLDTFFDTITNFFNSQNFFGGSLLNTALLPIIVIAAGVILLILALIIVLRPKKYRPSSSVNQSSATPTPAPQLHAKPNPPPPPIPSHGTIMPQQTSVDAQRGKVVSGSIKNPEVIETSSSQAPVSPAPEVEPPTAMPSNPVVSESKPNQSMMQRLREKGINVPETTPEGDSQPPTSAWPDESQQ